LLIFLQFFCTQLKLEQEKAEKVINLRMYQPCKEKRESLERMRELERRLHLEQTRTTSLTRDLEHSNNERQHVLEEYKALKDKYENKLEQKRKLGLSVTLVLTSAEELYSGLKNASDATANKVQHQHLIPNTREKPAGHHLFRPLPPSPVTTDRMPPTLGLTLRFLSF
jgi:hypothetical protein